MRYWLAAIAVGLVGCSSGGGSSVLTAVPLAVPAVSKAAVENTYVGVLVNVINNNATEGWRIRNVNRVGNLPVDVSNLLATAKSLNGRFVTVKAHSITGPNGQPILLADAIQPYNPS